MKSPSSLFVAAAVTVAAVAAAVYTERRFRRRRDSDGDGNDGKKLDFKVGSHESLVNERFQACVQVMGPQLARLPQRTQLDYYGMYKQGTLGDCSEYQSEPPPSYDLVATYKYQAWSRLMGMDRMTAMQNYIDKALHFQFIKNIGEGDDQDYELEGDAAIDMMGLGDKPSTLVDEYDEDAMALEDSQYPVHAAAREGKLEELKTLLETGSTTTMTNTNTSPNTLDVSGQTPLHLATDRGHIECVKTLVLAGADINSVDHDGISILQAAVIGGNKECCQLLLILGANPDLADHDGDTPRDSAQDDTELKELFQKYDDKALSPSEQLLDPIFLKELQHRNISIDVVPIQTKTAAAPKSEGNNTGSNTNTTSAKPVKLDMKQEMKSLDEAIDIDLDDDGDMFWSRSISARRTTIHNKLLTCAWY